MELLELTKGKQRVLVERGSPGHKNAIANGFKEGAVEEFVPSEPEPEVATDYSSMTVRELRGALEAAGVEVHSGMSKAKLIEAAEGLEG